MVKIKELRTAAVKTLKASDNDSPLKDTDFILSSMGFSKTDIIIGDKSVDEETEMRFSQAIERVKIGEPVQYVVGGCEFMSMWFAVSPATLIPRCDTEILVEKVIELCKDKLDLNIFEVGSGSGCIAISLAKFLPEARVISADISADALEVAKKNAKALGVSDRVSFIEWDVMKGFPEFLESPNVIVSNPPYIPKSDILELDKKVKDFEPLTALDGGEDGLDFYRLISKKAPLKDNGIIAFEVGIGQADAVAGLLSTRFTGIEITKDLSGIDRVVTAKMQAK